MSLFSQAKHKELSSVVSLRNIAEAKLSVQILHMMYHSAMTKTKRLRIARATLLAANRSKVLAKKRSISGKEKSEFRRISDIYRISAANMFESYRRTK